MKRILLAAVVFAVAPHFAARAADKAPPAAMAAPPSFTPIPPTLARDEAADLYQLLQRIDLKGAEAFRVAHLEMQLLAIARQPAVAPASPAPEKK